MLLDYVDDERLLHGDRQHKDERIETRVTVYCSAEYFLKRKEEVAPVRVNYQTFPDLS